MNDYIVLRAGPLNEPLVNEHDENYDERAKIECAAYLAELRARIGDEPRLAALTTKNINGTWTTVCWYQKGDRDGLNYAKKAENNPPKQWTGVGLLFMKDMQTWKEETIKELGITMREFNQGRY